MAGETTSTSAVDAHFTKWFDSQIAQEIRPLNIPVELCKRRGKEMSNVFRFTFLGDPGVATAKAEGSAMANTSLTTSGQDVTVGTVGQMATVTKEHAEISLYNAYSTYGAQLIRSVAEKVSTDFAAVLDDSTNTTGSSGVDLVLSDVLEASTALRGRDATGQLAGVLHTRQIGDLQNDLGSSTASANTNAPMIGDLDASNLGEYAGTWYRIPFWQSSLINTADAGANRHGAIFVVDDAFGYYEIWGAQSDTDKDIALPGTEIAVTARYAFGKIRDNNTQGIKTDA